MPQGTIVNTFYYQKVLDRLCKRITCVRLELWKDRSFFLLHDNATTISGQLAFSFYQKKKKFSCSYSSFPVLTDLGFSDQFLFFKLKMDLKKDNFKSLEKIQEAVITRLNSIVPCHEKVGKFIVSHGDPFE